MALFDNFALILTVVSFLALSAPKVVRALQQPGKRWKPLRDVQRRKLHGLVYSALLLIPYLLAAAPDAADDLSGFASGLALMALYLLAPMGLQQGRKGNAARPDVLDMMAVLLLWLPAEFGWLPDVRVAGAPLAPLLGTVNALLIYVVVAPWKPRAGGKGGVGYTFRLTAQDVGIAVLALLAFAAVGIPLGLLTGFLAFEPQVPEFVPALLALLAGYLFTALPEELLFRGLIQNGLERLYPKAKIATLIAPAVLFGLAHLNNPTPGYPVPNAMYAVMATLAGLAYGYVWRRTGKITASAITHALVNFIWGLLLAA